MARLQMANQLTRETATAVLHLLHHLGTGTYIERLRDTLWLNEYDAHGRGREVRNGTHLNPAIFSALCHMRRGRMLELHFCSRFYLLEAHSVFRVALEDGCVRLHSYP